MKRLLVILAPLLVFAIVAITYAQGPGMMGPGMMQSEESQKSSEETSGVKTFNANCRVCHVNGGNVINPNMPLRGSSKLAEFKSFLAFIRDPKMPDGSKGPMPSFSEAQISDKQAKELYQHITSEQGLDLTSKGQGWYCSYCGQYIGPRRGYGMGLGMVGGYGMMGGYGIGPGMMGGYGMGPGMMGRYGMGPWGRMPWGGMMGPGMMRGVYGYGYDYGHGMEPGMMGPGYYSQSEECQRFLDKNAGVRKELNNKRFEYFEAMRNPKTTAESLAKQEKELFELQEKIYSKAPQGCWIQ